MTAHLRGRGHIDVILPTGEHLCDVAYGTHLKNWQWRQVQGAAPWEALDENAKYEVVYSTVAGTNAPLRVRTKAWEQDGGVMVECETFATAEEADIASSCLRLMMPASYWEGGQAELNAKLDLPPPGSTMAEGSNLFTKAPSAVQNVKTFSFYSKGGACLKVQVMDSPATRVNFVDVRKWGPHFEIRIGEMNNVTFKEGDTKRWRVHLSLPNTGLRLVSLRATLTIDQKKHLKEKGYLQLSDMLPPNLVAAALKTVNRGLAKGGDPKKMDKEFTHHATLCALVNNTRIRGILDSLLGAGCVHDVGGAQIALIFPQEGNPVPTQRLGHHIDGLPTMNNGVEKGRVHNFTLLIGVYLSDVTNENSGNFTVFPGSHLLHAEWFKKNKPESLLNAEGFMTKMPEIEKPQGVQIKAKAGDVVIAHYLTAHAIATNVSPNIRYALYFRVTSTKQAENAPLRLQEPFMDWVGLENV